ncbi:MAG: MaoC family dehydratase N-terminal domain-containing protein [Pseudomonadota bacterium]
MDQSVKITDWVGRSQSATEVLSPTMVTRWAATIGRSGPPAAQGDLAPRLSHWLHFQPAAEADNIGPDGHPARGGFLPPIHDLPRRMWAGSRISFPGELRLGEQAVQCSTITDVVAREGRNGRLVFVTVRHEVGSPGAPPAIIDEQDIVYRGEGAPTVGKPAEPGAHQRQISPDPVMLFRYSAVTFNGHRIHYDEPYVTKVEGYPGLVVHGPLVATLLLDLVERTKPGATIKAFSFRALAPFFADDALDLNATPLPSGELEVFARNHKGHLGMKGTIAVAET